MVWLGDGNNVCASLPACGGQFGFDMVFAGPDALDPDPKPWRFARDQGVHVEIMRDATRAVAGPIWS